MTKPGTYKASATYKRNLMISLLILKKVIIRQLVLKKDSFKYIIGPYSTMDEVKEIIMLQRWIKMEMILQKTS